MLTGEPTKLDTTTGDERAIYESALDHICSACGADPGHWCFRGVFGVWTLHAERIIAWGRTP